MGDPRYTVRQLLRSPGFAAVAMLSLSLGIAANTTIFTFVNVLLLRPPPAEAPEQLWQVWRQNPEVSSALVVPRPGERTCRSQERHASHPPLPRATESLAPPIPYVTPSVSSSTASRGKSLAIAGARCPTRSAGGKGGRCASGAPAVS